MSKYELVSGIIFPDGTLVPQGKVVELDDKDDATKDYLKRGSIKPYVKSDETSEESTSTIEGETVKEFELSEYSYKQIQTADGIRYTQNDVEISEDAFVSAYQIYFREQEEARQNSENNATEGETSTAPVTPVVPGQPTQEQIDADLNQPGV